MFYKNYKKLHLLFFKLLDIIKNIAKWMVRLAQKTIEFRTPL